jgi:uncharacterized membrane protein YccC
MIISSMVDMLLGMILGMVASPLLMKLIRSLQQRRRVDKLLREAADLQRHYNNNLENSQNFKVR